MSLENRYERIGTYETKCQKCGKDVVSTIWVVYTKEGQLLKAFGGCPKCAATVYEKQISDESEISPDVKRFSNPIPLDDKPKTDPFKPTVKCPYCNSTNTKKISTLSRMGSFATFGFAGKKVGKQWHCNNCKSDF